ncbi:MAG: phosphatase PAP2 family protein [Candidatus Micrarchaeota archaeon]|nr:phosphatase PAP2 family protein [Candidatus Micrarchaeota archaeon]MDE1847537.1 phosphatase PAP2 family protein [Candidatus Micrarchaeota archaeon]MDE1864254.1 phosphatase PAP2 family protein [Candidatus Micrarchaeota archaeon]
MDIVSAINAAAFQAAGSLASPALTTVMQYLAESFYVVLAAIIIYMYVRKDRNVFSLVLSIIVLFLLTEIIKDIFRQPRPCTAESFPWANGICESGFSFPSNHAATLTGLLFFVKGYRYLRILYLAWLLLVLFGRVYLGQHYLTDVIAGAVLSFVVAYAIYSMRNKINKLLGGIAHIVLRPLFGGEWAK